jgi:hypothetical protein
LVVAMDGVELARFEASPAALAQAKASLERHAASLSPREVPREEALEYIVAREVAEGDAEAARGALMSAGAILPGPQSARLFQRLRAGHTDDDIVNTALRFIEPDLANRFLGVQGGVPSGAGGGAFFIVGDDRELAGLARRWSQGAQADLVALVLSGLIVTDLGLPAADAETLRVGASMLKSAKSAGRLSPELSARLTMALATLAPPASLREKLAAALADPAALADEGAAVKSAFAAAIAPAALQKLAPRFAALRAIVAHTSPAGALRLINLAREPADFDRLALLAQAGRERAVLVAKRTSRPAAVLDSAPVTWRVPGDVAVALAVLLVGLIALLSATVMVLKHAVERTIHTPPGAAGPALPKPAKPRQLAKPASAPPETVG